MNEANKEYLERTAFLKSQVSPRSQPYPKKATPSQITDSGDGSNVKLQSTGEH